MNGDKNMKRKIRFTGISTSILGLSWEYIDGKSEKIELLRELYDIRNQLVRFYYMCEEDIGINGIDFSDGDKVVRYYDLSIKNYELVGNILFKSRYFALLPLIHRQQIIETFDSVMQLDELLMLDEDNVAEDEDIQLMVNDLNKLFEQINKAINELNSNLDKKV